MFVVKHNAGLYLYPNLPSELNGMPIPFEKQTLIFAASTQTKDRPKLFSSAKEAWDFIADNHIGTMAKPQQIVIERNEDPALGEMIYIVVDIEGLAVKVTPFRKQTIEVYESVLSVDDLKFQF